MTKEQFLTERWNNVLALALGIPAVIYVAFVLSTSVLSESAAFIGFAIIGVLY